ncbi:aspartyl protease family protein [bacterium]|nr:aspartyl protease family protein [bacterium]MBU1752533.1 aspartyl protease family protein [bacterium]
MGEVNVTLYLENAWDRYRCACKEINETQIRKEEITALVDTGAVMLMLPQDLVEALGLISTRKAIVRYADERKEERDIAGMVAVKIGKREMMTECIVGYPGSEPLVGQIVMEVMDLLVDCNEQTLKPRPESPYLPLLKMK